MSEGTASRGSTVADGPSKNSRVRLTGWVDTEPIHTWADEKTYRFSPVMCIKQHKKIHIHFGHIVHRTVYKVLIYQEIKYTLCIHNGFITFSTHYRLLYYHGVVKVSTYFRV